MMAMGAMLGIQAASTAAQYALSSKEAKKQRRFQERMAKTKYQYTMEDMRKAGLNPMLAYQQGAGATPPGAMAPVPDFGAAAPRGVEAGAKASLATAQKGLLTAQAGASTAAGANQNAQAALAREALPEAHARALTYSTPEGQSALKYRELFGGKGFMPGVVGGAAGTARGAYEYYKRNKEKLLHLVPKRDTPREIKRLGPVKGTRK